MLFELDMYADYQYAHIIKLSQYFLNKYRNSVPSTINDYKPQYIYY